LKSSPASKKQRPHRQNEFSEHQNASNADALTGAGEFCKKLRGKLFYRLIQQAVAIEPVTLDMILHPDNKLARKLASDKAPGEEQGITSLPSQTNIA